jgi:cephalosporin hydroxylase
MPAVAHNLEYIAAMEADQELKELRQKMLLAMLNYRYSFNFTWFGRPIIQIPDDILAVQEIVMGLKPDLIIETGIAHGGTLALYASLLELLGQGEVVGVDIDIRPHNLEAIRNHPLSKRMCLIQGSSTSNEVLEQVRALARGKQKVMVSLDSDHTHAHVLKELQLYAPLVTKGSYLIVFDTVIEDLPPGSFPDRAWDKGNNPKTAVWEFLRTNDRFVIDKDIDNKLLTSVAPDGYLRCVKD